MFLNWFAINYFDIFASMFIKGIGLQFSFFLMFLSGFGNSVMLASENEFGSVPSLSVLFEKVEDLSS